MNWKILLLVFVLSGFTSSVTPYPIDGYETTGIRRLKRLQLIEDDEMNGRKLIPGALKSIEDIQLHLLRSKGDSLNIMPEPDSLLQKKLEKLFPNRHESYSVTLMDITAGKKTRFAHRQADRGFQPGSVGKLIVISGFFYELYQIYPDDFKKRQELMKTKLVRAGSWAIYDEHTVPFFDVETKKYYRRQVRESDVLSLYEWADHMMSASNNGAASIIWREAILMRAFGKDYPTLTQKAADEYFKTTPRKELTEMAEAIHEPLRRVGITEEQWRLGSMFTRGAKRKIQGRGGSRGTPMGLMKWLVELERGYIVDIQSSLEIKRLMYMTDRRIRYASSKKLKDAAVYFKSGSLYSCIAGTKCRKYYGTRKNYMNSVAIVEQPDGTTYLVALMSNVLKKNSSYEHNYLAGRIDQIVKECGETSEE